MDGFIFKPFRRAELSAFLANKLTVMTANKPVEEPPLTTTKRNSISMKRNSISSTRKAPADDSAILSPLLGVDYQVGSTLNCCLFYSLFLCV